MPTCGELSVGSPISVSVPARFVSNVSRMRARQCPRYRFSHWLRSGSAAFSGAGPDGPNLHRLKIAALHYANAPSANVGTSARAKRDLLG
jgi:hypothetical protein